MKYTCPNCGKEHEDWPAIAFPHPDQYALLSNQEQATKATLSSDSCVIQYEDQTDLFIRTVLHQKVQNHCQTADYGVWVSLSESSFADYVKNYNNEAHTAIYFGFLCNNIPGYENTLLLKTDVRCRGNSRPEIIPHSDQMHHAFVQDYYNGIEWSIAESRIREAMENNNA